MSETFKEVKLESMYEVEKIKLGKMKFIEDKAHSCWKVVSKMLDLRCNIFAGESLRLPG